MEQMTIFEQLTQADFSDLPGFKEAKTHLEKEGHPSDWIYETVDTSNATAHFVKSGKPWYVSKCPHYQGFWLLGGCGSVQCTAHNGLLPGLMWENVCKGDFESCPFYKKQEE